MLIFLNVSNPTFLTDLSDLTSEFRENSNVTKIVMSLFSHYSESWYVQYLRLNNLIFMVHKNPTDTIEFFQKYAAQPAPAELWKKSLTAQIPQDEPTYFN